MLGYNLEQLNDMIDGVENALLLINADENPAIHRCLNTAGDFLNGLWAEGYFDHA